MSLRIGPYNNDHFNKVTVIFLLFFASVFVLIFFIFCSFARSLSGDIDKWRSRLQSAICVISDQH
jgi:hypothetical protein